MLTVSYRLADLDKRKHRFGGGCSDWLRLWSWRADCLLTCGIKLEEISCNLCDRRAVLQRGDKGMLCHSLSDTNN